MRHSLQLAALGLFDTKVPRYTSYPTAPHFKSSNLGDDVDTWIEGIPSGSSVSIYVHIPFCRRLCWFCACRTQGTATGAPVRAYLDTLKQEISLLRKRLPAGIRISRLHWGGGTPTMLDAEMIPELAEAIFDVAPLGENAEFSVEIDPNEIDQARVDALVSAGMTRASVGVQDFDLMVQNTIGRHQSFELTRDVIAMVRAAGVASLNADILYGLPHQTKGRLTASVEKLLSLSPDRVALYGYAHVPWMAKRQQLIPSDSLPTPEERLQLFETADTLFRENGYEAIGIDHFAKPADGLATAAREGRLRRNFQGYTDDTAGVLIGLGASSISRFPQGYAQNAPATSAYTDAVRKGRLPVTRGHIFGGEDLLRGRIIEALMCDFEVRTDELVERFGLAPEMADALFAPVAAKFGKLVEWDGSAFRILGDGRLLTRMIAREFDAYTVDQAGHSHAI